MKRRLGLLAASALLATVGMMAPSPASAHTMACAGTGTATLTGAKLGLPVLTSNTTNFVLGFTAGACATVVGVSDTLSASGTVTGACGLSTGSGTVNGDGFSFTSTGTVLVLTGAVVGVVSALEDPLDAGSCTNETAENFLITGVAVHPA